MKNAAAIVFGAVMLFGGNAALADAIDGDWCHAESDNVDEQGNVVVLAAEVSTVWVFHCGGGS